MFQNGLWSIVLDQQCYEHKTTSKKRKEPFLKKIFTQSGTEDLEIPLGAEGVRKNSMCRQNTFLYAIIFWFHSE